MTISAKTIRLGVILGCFLMPLILNAADEPAAAPSSSTPSSAPAAEAATPPAPETTVPKQDAPTVDAEKGAEKPAEQPAAVKNETPTPPATDAQKALTAPVDQKGEANKKTVVRPKLDDKLYLATAFGWVKTSASKGDWVSSGLSNVEAGYSLPLSSKIRTWAVLRYEPIYVTLDSDDVSYKGLINRYDLGAKAQYKLRPKLDAFAQCTLGVAQVQLKKLSDGVTDGALSDSGAIFAVAGGVNWHLIDKVVIRPELSLGFGRFSMVQFITGAEYYF